MSVIANLTILSSGMALGFAAISMDELTNGSDALKLSQEEFSWFGKLFRVIK